MKYVPEILTALSATVGWFLTVWALSVLLTVWVWPVGAGLYLLGLAGFRLVGVVMWQGLYSLSREEEDES